MQELMLRLLKDGKIVGFMWLGDFNTSNGLTVRWKRIDEPDDYTHPIKPLNFDSFEMGVQVGETWFFDGDIIEFSHSEYIDGSGEIYQTKETLEYRGNCFWIMSEDGNIDDNPIFESIDDETGEWCAEATKVIGNIHEQ